MNCAQSKGPVSHVSCWCCGSILVSYTRGGRLEPFYYNGIYFCHWIRWFQWKHLGKTPLNYYPTLENIFILKIRWTFNAGMSLVKRRDLFTWHQQVFGRFKPSNSIATGNLSVSTLGHFLEDFLVIFGHKGHWSFLRYVTFFTILEAFL